MIVNTYGKDHQRLNDALGTFEHVLGYMVQGEETETLFAVHTDGRTLTKTVARPNAYFGGRGWVSAMIVPDDAQFIGRYFTRHLFTGGL